jgi:hypothetical protein
MGIAFVVCGDVTHQMLRTNVEVFGVADGVVDAPGRASFCGALTVAEKTAPVELLTSTPSWLK